MKSKLWIVLQDEPTHAKLFSRRYWTNVHVRPMIRPRILVMSYSYKHPT